MSAEWARSSILSTLDEIRAGQRILNLRCEPDELDEAHAIIARIEARMAKQQAAE